MDTLNRWSIAVGAGALAGMMLILGNYLASDDAKDESTRFAVNQLTQDRKTLDARVEFATYSIEEMSDFADLLVEEDLKHEIWCGGYQNPAHICTVDADIPAALDLASAYAPVLRDEITLTVGTYVSEYADVLGAAHTVITDTGAGVQNVTNEGGVFTVSYLERGSFASNNEPWQYALATVPGFALWLSAAAIAVIGTVLAAATIRPSAPEPVETVGIEYFDEPYPS